jgi:hypothetical protein
MRLVMMLGFRASSCPLLTNGSMAWNVNSVSERPSSPASNFMVGTQRPKSRPLMVEATNPGFTPVIALEEAGAGVSVEVDVDAASAVVLATSVAATSADELVDEVAPRVTVTKVVWTHPVAATWTEDDATDETATEAATEEAATSPEELPAAGAVPTVPSTALVVKFEKP